MTYIDCGILYNNSSLIIKCLIENSVKPHLTYQNIVDLLILTGVITSRINIRKIVYFIIHILPEKC